MILYHYNSIQVFYLSASSLLGSKSLKSFFDDVSIIEFLAMKSILQITRDKHIESLSVRHQDYKLKV